MYPVIAQPQDGRRRFDEDFVDYNPEERIMQPYNRSNLPSRFVAATEASMRFSAVVPMGRSAITSSSKPVPCSNSNSNSNDITNITNITNITSIENAGLVDGSMIVEVAMSPGG